MKKNVNFTLEQQETILKLENKEVLLQGFIEKNFKGGMNHKRKQSPLLVASIGWITASDTLGLNPSILENGWTNNVSLGILLAEAVLVKQRGGCFGQGGKRPESWRSFLGTRQK